MENRNSSLTVNNMSVHTVWLTKYRYHVLKGDIQSRCRDLIIQMCNSENVKILKGVVSKDHVHIHVEYPPSLSVSVLVKKSKGRSYLLQQEYQELKKRYWGQHLWDVGYCVWSTIRITDEIVLKYLEHHKDKPNSPQVIGFFSNIIVRNSHAE